MTRLPAASYLFYAGWDWRFLSLIVASTLVDVAEGRRYSGTAPWRGAAARGLSYLQEV